ncbi:calcium-binding protein [Tabrizicola sp.]|uniref:calcium-binding protein n=1 Tax=Tabrizicola sp. TaxID=2005166 RepID=UPI003D2D9026
MLIEATSQTVAGMVYVLTGNDDLNVASGVTLISTTSDAILANSGQHQITVSGLVMAYDDAINTIGCEEAQSIVIASGGVLIAGYTGAEEDADGVILDGIDSTLVNNGTIIANGSGLSLFVRDWGTTTITNNGFISGEKYGVWNKFGLGVLNFTNTGTIESPVTAFFGGSATDNLTNSGTFIGDVRLNGGDDTYIGIGGTVLGLIHGGDGDDTFVPGNNADSIDGGFGIDTLDFSGVTVALVIDLANGANNRGLPALGDSYSNIEIVQGGTKADVITGDAFDNILFGNNGSDRLNGGAGQDILVGGTGGDILTGGAGSDIFVFNAQGDFRDQITDFTVGEDFLRFDARALGLGSNTISGGLDPARFHSSTTNAAADALDRLIFRTTDATLWFDRDGSGTKHQAILVADLNDGIALTAASIDVISPFGGIIS